MPALGLILIFGGLLLGRQILAGRVKETASDAKDITLSVLTGDFAGLNDVLSQRGTNVSPDVSSVVAADTSGEASPVAAGTLLAEMQRLGSAAKGYRWGADGPDYYDCSGLLWVAMKNTGVYTGTRFTTATFVRQLGNRIAQVQSPQVGDIVIWPSTHIGIVSGPNQFYSAKSPKSGIGFSPITGSGIAGTPVYYRINGA